MKKYPGHGILERAKRRFSGEADEMGIGREQKQLTRFAIFFLTGAALSVMLVAEPGHPWLRFFWSGTFASILKILLGAAAVMWILKKVSGVNVPRGILKWVYGFLFLPVVLFPVFRCYFKVPYVFCRACPSPCPWGVSRSFFFSGFLVLNFPDRFWCSSLCPFGTLQEDSLSFSKRFFRLPTWTAGMAYIVLFAVLGLYLTTLFDWPWLNFFDVGHYAFFKVTAVGALLIFAAGFFVPKFWCRCFCPVGTIDLLIASFRKAK